MNRLIATPEQFSFQGRELSQQLLEHIQNGKVGYWEHQFDGLLGKEQLPWHLAIANDRVLYSGHGIWSVQSLMTIIYRYASHTRNDLVKSRCEQLQRQAQSLDPTTILAEMNRIGIINDAILFKVLKAKILHDLDLYLSIGSGKAKFIPDLDLTTQLPLAGFQPQSLLDEAKQRQSQWEKLQPQVPSMNLIPVLDPQAIAKANLPAGQQQRIENLVKSGQTLNAIAEEMAKDTLEIAEMFAKLAKVGLVGFRSPKKNTPAPIMVIDDSPPILVQFQRWVGDLGYPVTICQQPETALAKIVEVEPAIIFIDLNMPGLSGFELVKQIRKQPQLANIPLVILTGEQKLSNRWRAQWSGCDFLTKPLESSDVIDFQIRLEETIRKLIGTPETIAPNNYSHN
jgi:CheY-like chemotaxis protein